MKRSRQELSIDVIIDGVIMKNNQLMLFLKFTFIPRNGCA